MNLFRVEKARVNEVDMYVIVCGKYRASKKELLSEEEAKTYIENMIDWDMSRYPNWRPIIPGKSVMPAPMSIRPSLIT